MNTCTKKDYVKHSNINVTRKPG